MIDNVANKLSSELRLEIKRLADMPSVRRRYESLENIFHTALSTLTSNVNYAFSGPTSQIIYVCQKYTMKHLAGLNALHHNLIKTGSLSDDQLEMRFFNDCRELSFLCSLIADDDTFEDFDSIPLVQHTGSLSACVRVAVLDFSSLQKTHLLLCDENKEVWADLSEFPHLASLIGVGTQLNLIGCVQRDDSLYNARLVIYEPDFLIDISSLARCFSVHADTHELYIINRLRPSDTTGTILLGRLAGQFLDETLASLRGNEKPIADYKKSLLRFFRYNTLDVMACKEIDTAWHDKAKQQQHNVIDMLGVLAFEDSNFKPQKTLTEPSFVSEALGVQGRMDLLQTDWKLLIEQKSGKKDEFRNRHQDEHYVQIALYQLLLSVNFDVDHSVGSQYLLYSRYEPKEGLVRESYASDDLAKKIFEIRNNIVFNELRYCSADALREDILSWKPSRFRTKRIGDTLWNNYIMKQLNEVFEPIQNASNVMKSYFFTMMAFLQRENTHARMGCGRRTDRGFSGLWNISSFERRRNGELIDSLKIIAMEQDDDEQHVSTDAVDFVTLETQRTDDDNPQMIFNFRVGDVVMLYDYEKGEQPDVRRAIDNRATVVSLSISDDSSCNASLSIRLKLRAPQSKSLFDDIIASDRLWAVEHDLIDSQFSRLCQQLVSLLRAPLDRQELLLGLRPPRRSRQSRPLHGSYNGLDDMVRAQQQAEEMFLLVGPPGTGKTSFGLMSILHEELSYNDHCVLLLSYTNRAVDEICSKLKKDGLHFLRIGSQFSCHPDYHDRLLCQQRVDNKTQLMSIINNCRVFVATTASLCSNHSLFEIKHFHLAIFDEASQILEPNIIGILSTYITKSSTTDNEEEGEFAVDRFVLIGDHKQLPAVVSQSKEESVVTDEILKEIRLTDCRRSFFERQLSLLDPSGMMQSPFVYTLTKQGRMHPETAAFSNKMFYGGRLQPIPLQHQQGDLCLPLDGESGALVEMLASKRSLFFNSGNVLSNKSTPVPYGTNGKVNMVEAAIVSRIAQVLFRLRANQILRVEDNKVLGIVVPYRNQISAIRSQLRSIASSDDETAFFNTITIDTVERFQGSERDVMVFDFTVNCISQLSFLVEEQFEDIDGTLIDRKLNVALSRAREQLIVVGNSGIISQEPFFNKLIEYAVSVGGYYDWNNVFN